MLVAEIYGKGMEEVRNHEDYLTSTVFSHLRYLPPDIFWQDFFCEAKGLPSADGAERVLSKVMERPVSNYKALKVYFWKSHPELGEPDLALHFTRPDHSHLVILMEAKLLSGKSGEGERDQLVRYLGILDALEAFLPGIPGNVQKFLVYLTPRDSLSEIEESLQIKRRAIDRDRIFRLRWQDIVLVAKRLHPSLEEPAKTILKDVMEFLQKRSLEYFDGFKSYDWLPIVERTIGNFYKSPVRRFKGFNELASFASLEINKVEWVYERLRQENH